MLAFFSGMNMMIVLRGYLVYDLTGSPKALAAIMLSVALPMLVIAPMLSNRVLTAHYEGGVARFVNAGDLVPRGRSPHDIGDCF